MELSKNSYLQLPRRGRIWVSADKMDPTTTAQFTTFSLSRKAETTQENKILTKMKKKAV
jgi:hypothetical protein